MAETLTKPARASTSTPETVRETRLRVRHKIDETVLSAVRATINDRPVILGRSRIVVKGDWLIYAESDLVDVVSSDLLTEFYTPLTEEGLTLSPVHLTRCGKVLRFGATKSAEEFTQAVESMVHVSIGGVEINWTPGQIDELKHRANKRGQSVELYVKILVDRFCQDLWTL